MAKTTKYSGTQTEKNLEAAFAGESQARNKYTYFASVAKKQGFEQIADLFLKTADNEKEHAKCGLLSLTESATQQKIFLPLPRAKTTSGQICTKISLKLPRKKALQSLHTSFALLPQLKSITKKDTVHYSAMLKLQKFSKGAKSRFGNAVTAVTLL